MFYSLAEAAEASGKSKMTIQRAIKAGKLSAGRDEGGAYQIDPAELHRVFPPETRPPVSPDTAKGQGDGAVDTAVLRKEIELRELRIDLLEAERRRERAQLEDQIDDLRRRLDTESEERKRLTLLITDQRPADRRQREATRRPLWAWLAPAG